MKKVKIDVSATAKTPPHQKLEQAKGFDMIFEGLRYIGRNKIVLGAISLDLFVVFFGGLVALLPVFARDILEVGVEGMGVLLGASAAGNLGADVLLINGGAGGAQRTVHVDDVLVAKLPQLLDQLVPDLLADAMSSREREALIAAAALLEHRRREERAAPRIGGGGTPLSDWQRRAHG